MFYQFMREQKANHNLRIMCRALGVSPSGYHKWANRKPSLHEIRDAEISHMIRRIHADTAAVEDRYTRQVVGWSMGERATVELVLAAINMAV